MAKKVLITGASSGLGEGMAREFAKRGYDLALAARRLDKLDALQKELLAHGGKVVIKQLDVTEYDQVFKVVEEIAEELGRIDIAVVNAGSGAPCPIGAGRFSEVKQTIEVGLLGAMATVEAVVPIMRAQKGGQIVGITSFSAVRGSLKHGAYSAANVGFQRYLQSLRLETLDDSIKVTELAPGYIDTAINRVLTNKPFIIPVEKGVKIMTDLIERQVKFSYVPAKRWALLALLTRILPDSVLAKQDVEA